MGDILSTGVSGLLAFQRAIDVTSNNIANVGTPGYSVQKANLSEQQAQPTASGYVGNGVTVTSITRAYDEALALQVRSAQSSYSNASTFADQAGLVDNLLSDSSTGLSASLQKFANALQGLANAPSSTAQRQVLLSQAQALAQQLQGYDGQIAQYAGNIEAQIGTTVTQINSIASGIAQLNAQIAAGTAATGQTPNALLDKRDALLDQLSQYVAVSTSSQPDGQLNVFIGTGQALVTGSVPQSVATIPDPYNASRNDIALVGGSGKADITAQITGGSLGGLLAVRSQVLDPARNALGRVSVGLATLMNQQQAAGVDLTGAAGLPMFSVGAAQSLPASTNAGTATVTTSLANPPAASLAALTGHDYRLGYAAGTWSLTDLSSGQTVALSGAGTAASPFQADGLSIVVGPGASSGDSWMIRPTAAATAGLGVLLTSPTQIAAASPIQIASAPGNSGTAAVSSSSVTDPTDPQLLATTTLTFTSPSTFQINGAGSYTYTPGQAIAVNGWSVTLSGTAAAGDSFTVSRNVNPSGDNRNALAMAAALSSPTLDAGTSSLSDAASNLVGQIGVATQQAQSSADVQQSMHQEAVTARNNLSGVNLDEEAAHLLAFQQAYQACAQIIQASNRMFDSLISAVHG